MAMTERLSGRVLVEGAAEGPALVLTQPLSFWGGVDPHRGDIIDRHHPQAGHSTTGRVLVMSHGRGSSSSSYVLADCIRAGTGPVAVVTEQPDSIIALGAMVAAELYPDRICPVLVVPDACRRISDGTRVLIGPGGLVDLLPPR